MFLHLSDEQRHLIRKLMVRWRHRWKDSFHKQFLQWYEQVQAEKDKEFRQYRSHLKTACKDILDNTEAGSRSYDQVKLVQEYCIVLGFVEGIEDMLMRKLAQGMKKRTYALGQLIFLQGSHGQEFFVVMKGTVGLFRFNTRDEEIKAASSIKALPSGTPVDEKLLGERLAIGCEGMAFGEGALLTGKPRQASALAKTEIVLMVVEENLYKECFYKVMEQRMEHTNRMDFLRQVGGINCLPNYALLRLASTLCLQQYPRGRWLIHQGEPAAGVFLISKGEAALHAKASVKEKKSNISNILEGRRGVQKKDGPDVFQFELRRLGHGCLIGHLEAVKHYETYHFSLLAHTDVTCYWITMSEFRESLLQAGSETLAAKLEIEALAEAHQQRFADQIKAESLKMLMLRDTGQQYRDRRKKTSHLAKLGGVDAMDPEYLSSSQTLHESFSMPLFRRSHGSSRPDSPPILSRQTLMDAEVASLTSGHSASLPNLLSSSAHHRVLLHTSTPGNILSLDPKQGGFPFLVAPGTRSGPRSRVQGNVDQSRPKSAPDEIINSNGNSLNGANAMDGGVSMFPVPIISRGTMRQELALTSPIHSLPRNASFQQRSDTSLLASLDKLVSPKSAHSHWDPSTPRPPKHSAGQQSSQRRSRQSSTRTRTRTSSSSTFVSPQSRSRNISLEPVSNPASRKSSIFHGNSSVNMASAFPDDGGFLTLNEKAFPDRRDFSPPPKQEKESISTMPISKEGIPTQGVKVIDSDNIMGSESCRRFSLDQKSLTNIPLSGQLQSGGFETQAERREYNPQGSLYLGFSQPVSAFAPHSGSKLSLGNHSKYQPKALNS